MTQLHSSASPAPNAPSSAPSAAPSSGVSESANAGYAASSSESGAWLSSRLRAALASAVCGFGFEQEHCAERRSFLWFGRERVGERRAVVVTALERTMYVLFMYFVHRTYVKSTLCVAERTLYAALKKVDVPIWRGPKKIIYRNCFF